MERTEVERLVAQGEGAGIEFKVRAPKPLRLARSICAFANSAGGVILIGVDDDGRIVGVDDGAETEPAVHACLAAIEPRPDVRIEAVVIGEAVVIVCAVAPGDRKPYKVVSERVSTAYIRAGATIRPVGTGKRLADEDVRRRRLVMTSLQSALVETIGRTEGIRIGVLAARHNLSKHRALKLLVPLVRAGVVLEKDGGYMLRA